MLVLKSTKGKKKNFTLKVTLLATHHFVISLHFSFKYFFSKCQLCYSLFVHFGKSNFIINSILFFSQLFSICFKSIYYYIALKCREETALVKRTGYLLLTTDMLRPFPYQLSWIIGKYVLFLQSHSCENHQFMMFEWEIWGNSLHSQQFHHLCWCYSCWCQQFSCSIIKRI